MSVTELRAHFGSYGVQPNRLFQVSAGLPGIVSAVILAQTLILLAAGLQSSIPLERLFRDTIAVAEDYPGCCHVYDGLISNLGILLWWAGACVTGFAALVGSRIGFRAFETRALIIACIFSAWLCMDDLFMLHESVLPRLGVPQPMTYAIYGGLGAAFVALGWRVILAPAAPYVVLALGMLGASAFVDVLSDHDFGAVSAWLHANPDIEILADDGFKFLGIGFWFCVQLVASAALIEKKR